MITRKEVENLLLDFGITPNIKGFHYITEAVMQYAVGKPIGNIYIDVASVYKTNYSSAERAIRHAFTKLNFDDVKVANFFKGCQRNNSGYISTIYLKLSREKQTEVSSTSSSLDIRDLLEVFYKFKNDVERLLQESEDKNYE